MRILLQSGCDVSLPGGVETHVRELAAGLVARGHAVELMGRASRPLPFPVIAHPDLSRYDVVHHHGGAWPAGLDAQRALVGTLHFCVAAKMETYVRIGRWRTLVNVANWRAVASERRLAQRAARLIAVAGRVRRDFARWHGLDPARATVIPNGVTHADPVADRAAVRARWGIAPDTTVLLTIGRDDFVKGYDLLGRAWKAAVPQSARAVWVTVGGSGTVRAPSRLVTGPLPHADVVDWIHAADLGALPSYYEGCSVALLEMLAGRLYTLAHDVGNAAEIIEPGVNGEILPRDARAWSTALTRLTAAPPERPRAGLPPGFEWSAIAEATERVYHEAIAAR